MANRPEYVTRTLLEETLKWVGENLGDQFVALSNRITELESELALQRALQPARKEQP